MRPRRLDAGRRGWWILLASGGCLGLLSAALFLFRAACEPTVRRVVAIVAGAHGYYRYQPGDYAFWAGLVGFLALSSIGLVVSAARRRPRRSRRIDAGLWSRLQPRSRHASPETKPTPVDDPPCAIRAGLVAIPERQAGSASARP